MTNLAYPNVNSQLEELQQFVHQAQLDLARRATTDTAHNRLGSLKGFITFHQYPWTMETSWWGDHFLLDAQILIDYHEYKCWQLNYQGKIIYPERTADVLRVIKSAIIGNEDYSLVRGPANWFTSGYHYQNLCRGDISYFTGKEQIEDSDMLKGNKIFVGNYQGSLINLFELSAT